MRILKKGLRPTLILRNRTRASMEEKKRPTFSPGGGEGPSLFGKHPSKKKRGEEGKREKEKR